MVIKFFTRLLFFTIIAIFQLSFIDSLPILFSSINLIIIMMVFSTEFSQEDKISWWFLFAGFLFDIYSPLFFGFFICFLPIVFLFTKIIASNILTNKSLYSFLLLTLLSVLFYNILFNSIIYISSIFTDNHWKLFILSKSFYINLLFGVVLNMLASAILFYGAGLVTKRFKSVFLFKGVVNKY